MVFVLFWSRKVVKMKGSILWTIVFIGVLFMAGVKGIEDDMPGWTKCTGECNAAHDKKANNKEKLDFNCYYYRNENPLRPNETFSGAACFWPCVEKFGKKSLGNSSLTIKITHLKSFIYRLILFNTSWTFLTSLVFIA